MAHYLVTGGAGFIGSHLVERLLAEGHRVRVLDDLSTGRESNLAAVLDRIDFVRGSSADAPTVVRALEGVDGVFHQAAIPSVPRSVANPAEAHRSIVETTLTLLEAMRQTGSGRIVMASSSSIYGESPALPKHEEMKLDPLSPYAAAKLAAEVYALVYARQYGLKAVALRYFNVFGPRQDPTSEYAAVIPKFVTAALEGRRPIIYGDGRQTRDFTYVENVVEANLMAMESSVSGVAMNIAAGAQISLLDVLELLEPVAGKPIEPEFRPARVGDIKHSFADITRARELIGFVPRVEFREGLSRTADWFRSRKTS